MQKFVWILLIVVSGAKITYAQNFNYHDDFVKLAIETMDPQSPYYYNQLLNRFQAQDSSLTNYEVLVLMIGFTRDKNYRPYTYYETERKLQRLNDKKKHKRVIDLSEDFLQQVPLSQSAIIERSYAFYKLGAKDSSHFYIWQFEKIMGAMLNSGDGATPETAFFALGPTDGQNFVTKYLGGTLGKMSSGKDKHNNFVDIVEIIYKDEESGQVLNQKIYFQIQHAIARMFQD